MIIYITFFHKMFVSILARVVQGGRLKICCSFQNAWVRTPQNANFYKNTFNLIINKKYNKLFIKFKSD